MNFLKNKYVPAFLVLALGMFMFTLCSFAEDAPDLGSAIVDLISAVKLGALAPILLAVVQLLKTDFLGGFIKKINTKYQPLIVIVIGITGNVALAASGGKSWGSAIIEGLVLALTTMGLYDAIKPIFKS